MPTCLPVFPNINRKSLRLTALLLLSPLFFFGQTLTGLWTGALSNDSTTVRKDQSFEIALTEYKGKVYGYSRSEFIVDDVLYYIVKRVTGTIVPGTLSGEGDVCEVTDDEIVSYNFPKQLDKKVKVTSTFRRDKNDSVWHLDGKWKTNVTKKYYSVTGKVALEQEKDLTASKIFPHLEELGLANDVAFYKDRKETPSIVRMAKPEKIKTEYSTKTLAPLNNTDVAIAPVKPDLQRAEARPVPVASTTDEVSTAEPDEEVATVKRPVTDLQKTSTKNIPQTTIALSPTSTTKTRVENKIPEVLTSVNKPAADIAANTIPAKKETVSTPVVKTQPLVITKQPDIKSVPKTIAPATSTLAKSNSVIQKQDVVIAEPIKTNTVAANNPVPEKKETKPAVDIIAKSALVAGRKSEFSQIVSFKSDSLELSLYDNGEIDGDTVSVFMNGEVIMARQGLKASAIKKTIYITPGNEDFTLVLFAENLGKYPPNTGLLVVHDGDDVYNLRFSSDFQKNAGIVFRRKK